MLPNMRNLSSRRRRMSGGSNQSLAQGKNFMANLPGQMGGGNVYHGAPVLSGDAMLLEGGDLRAKAGVEGLDGSTAAIRGMQDGGSRRRRRNRSNRRNRSRRNNATAMRRGRNNKAMRRGRNNTAMRRGRNNTAMLRGRNNATMRRGRNNTAMRRGRNRRNNQMGGEGEIEEEQYGGEGDELPVTPLERRRNNMYGGAHNLLPTQYAPVNQPSGLISGAAAARAGTAFTSDPFANGSGSA